MADSWAWLESVRVVMLFLLPGGLWCVWWLFGVNWQKLWPILALGAWVPVVLLMIVCTLAWAEADPTECGCLGVTIPAGLWHLGGVCALVAIALFCGWLQGVWGLTPPEIPIEPPAGAHAGEHNHHH